MSLMMEDDKPVKPTNISFLCTGTEKICADYFPDMIKKLRFFYLDNYCRIVIQKQHIMQHLTTICNNISYNTANGFFEFCSTV